MKKIILFVAVIASVFYAQTSSAEIYKWIDEQGNAHYTDNPPDNKKVEEVDVKINTYSAVTVTPLVERLGKKGKVVMYTATWCGICKKAERYFRKNKIAYVAYDVEKSRIGKVDFKLLKGRSVPVLIIGDKRMNGFTVSRFERVYKAQMKKQEQALAEKEADI